ncbi:protein OS-9 homolog [Rutidosis leptorrhynchoides]|uniref:protein OS-9 homolog n=1 Tax=Rutidosis leptorrhynchoides TaxID=125765 RepID=UPI003A99C89F
MNCLKHIKTIAISGRCLQQEGWWLYEFCYHKKLRQIHVEDDKSFVLGEYDSEATTAYNSNLYDISTLKDPRSKDALQRYHAHQYKNGTTCDLTNKPRETEVRFVCLEPRTMISSMPPSPSYQHANMHSQSNAQHFANSNCFKKQDQFAIQ